MESEEGQIGKVDASELPAKVVMDLRGSFHYVSELLVDIAAMEMAGDALLARNLAADASYRLTELVAAITGIQLGRPGAQVVDEVDEFHARLYERFRQESA